MTVRPEEELHPMPVPPIHLEVALDGAVRR